MPTKCTCWNFLNTRSRRASSRSATRAAASGRARRARAALHRGQAAPASSTALVDHGAASDSPVSSFSSIMTRRARRLQGPRVGALMVVGGQGEGHQHRGLAGRGQLGAGGGAAAADARGRPGRSAPPCRRGRRHLGLAARRARRRRRTSSRMASPVWWTMRSRSAPGRCGSAATIARLRTREPWLPAEHEQRVAARRCSLRRQAREAAAHGVAR